MTESYLFTLEALVNTWTDLLDDTRPLRSESFFDFLASKLLSSIVKA